MCEVGLLSGVSAFPKVSGQEVKNKGDVWKVTAVELGGFFQRVRSTFFYRGVMAVMER